MQTSERTAARRVDFMDDVDDHTLLKFIALGYSSRFILEHTGLSIGQITYRARKLKDLGISRTDYRNGASFVAQIVQQRADKQIEEALMRHLRDHL